MTILLHPTIKKLSSFTHPQVVANLNEFLLLNTKEDILKNDWNFGTIDFHSIFFFFYNGSQWGQTTVWFQSFFKISSFVFSRRKKLILVCYNLKVSK